MAFTIEKHLRHCNQQKQRVSNTVSKGVQLLPYSIK